MRKQKIIISSLLVGIVLIMASCNISLPYQNVTPTPTETVQPTTAPLVLPDVIAMQDTLTSLYAKVNPGVVAILTMGNQGSTQGSGFVYDTAGHIVTNYHVIYSATTIEVTFASGYKTYAEVIGKDTDSDLAVLKVNVPAEELHPIPLGDSSQLKVGQVVVAIGNPFGLDNTMTLGIISAQGRTLDSIRQNADGTYFTTGDLIQTDALINPGNSGGPLINLNGEVIGINRAIQTSGAALSGQAINSGIGFSISSNIVRTVMPSLISQGYYDYPYLGLASLNSISLSLMEALGLPQATGAYVTSVVRGGPAEKAGIIGGTKPTQYYDVLSGGDLIIAVDGTEINYFSEVLNYMLLSKKPGDVIVLSVIRDGERLDIPVTLDKRP